MLDSLTIVFMLEVMPTIMAVVCLGLMRALPDRIHGPGVLAAALLLMALASVCVRLPWHPIWAGTLGTACFATAMALLPVTFAVVDERKPRYGHSFAMAAIACVGYGLMHWQELPVHAPIALMGLAIVCTGLAMHTLIAGADRGYSFARKVALAGLLLVMLSALIRVKGILGETSQEAIENGREHVILVSYLTVLLVGLMVVSVGLILLATERLRAMFEHQARHDALTGVLSRRGLWESGEAMLAQARQRKQALSLLMIDVDLFKQINDRYGHLTGDEALVHLVGLIRAELAEGDVMGRFGGEEFAVLTFVPASASVETLAQRLCHAVASQPARIQGESIPLTVSIGCSLPGPAPRTLDPLIRAADQALYRAKAAGRNQAHVEPVQLRAE